MAKRQEMDWRGQQDTAKVIQVRDNDVDFERHLGGICAVSWIWRITQRWDALKVSLRFLA
uniref:Uncharacterized protein n=1 Tax=Colobus angolensis palliatus TaxID=336983 RepID=A0A2K5IK64_COLAP